MPDVVELIKAQHRKIDQLLEQAESEGADTAALLQQVSDLLLPHSEAEESFVYPAIRQRDDREASEVKDGVAEHHHMEGLLSELLQEEAGGPGYDGKLAAFVAELRHHVEEEEQDLLPVLSDKASDAEREQMGLLFAERTRDDGSSAPSEQSGSGDATESMTRDELYEKAKEQDVPGRSSMTKDELRDAVEGQ
jgi:hemerythrin superfamily protein